MSQKTVKAIVNFESDSDSQLLARANLIIEGMTGNAHFPNPTPTIAVLTTLKDDYSASLVAAGTGNRAAASEKNDQRLVLETNLCTLGNYINTVARNNLTAILTSNYPPTKDPEPSYLGPVEMMKLTPGMNSGSLICKLSRVKNSKSYTFMITEDPITDDSLWKSYVSTRCSFEFTKLVPGKKYWVKVIVAGTKNQTVQSGPISQYALQ